ncbi:hypothetical protein [Marinibactrum halimedae]|uniref:Uncharacterized protein n=1 Tax=Marinibactrum halimedae TaxID=1444977 RepID=A0AA37T585_9GAMM|nr:hypothetical protein [Marinibactrum halimedae]MCD9460269.1 hypothetical protein [Marinibactrum halimedae]GLS24356.1 hypothetical protein GCM10007877_00670 [Marinibactrum halimedae]
MSKIAIEKGQHRVVVENIGTANADCVAALSKALQTKPEAIATCLYQAPRVLFDNLSEKIANEVASLLRNLGLAAQSSDQSSSLTPGTPDYDVCLQIQDYQSVLSLILEVSRFLGIPPESAKKLVMHSPSILLGQVSCATAEAIAERFSPLGAVVNKNKTRDSHYLVLIKGKGTKAELDKLLKQSQIQLDYEHDHVNWIQGGYGRCGYAQAQQLWKIFQPLSDKVLIVAENFVLVDVVCESVTDVSEFKNVASMLSMPDSVFVKLCKQPKFLLKKSATLSEVHSIVAAGRRSVKCITILPQLLQSFDVRIGETSLSDEILQSLSIIIDKPTEEVKKHLYGGGAREGMVCRSLNYNQANWLRVKLKEYQISAKITAVA